MRRLNALRPTKLTRRSLIASLAAAPMGISTLAKAAGPGLSVLDLLPPSVRAEIRAGTSEYDCGPAISEAFSRSPRVYLPRGRYLVATPIRFSPRFEGRFASGPTLLGDGVGYTTIDARVGSEPVLEFDSGATEKDFQAIAGLDLSGFSIVGQGIGIRVRGCFMPRIEDISINGLSIGIEIVCRHGDNDGSNMVALERVRIDNCTDWGIDATAAPGRNEISFLSMRHVFVQGCGRINNGDPLSGGMRWKGQILDTDQCAFALNANAGLYIPGQAGLAINARLTSTTFENNFGRHLLCTGISVFQGENLQFFSNDEHRVAVACEFRGDRFTVRGVSIDGVTVRATAGNNPYTAFRFGGIHLEPDDLAIRNIIWANFGYPGQLRSDGVLSL